MKTIRRCGATLSAGAAMARARGALALGPRVLMERDDTLIERVQASDEFLDRCQHDGRLAPRGGLSVNERSWCLSSSV